MIQKPHNTFLGKKGEDAIVNHLSKQGYAILARNYKGAHGEIDIIAQKNSTIAFVEVKLRKQKTISLESLISTQKQQRIEKTAQRFIAQHQKSFYDAIFRFDVALATYCRNTDTIDYTYIESAFLSHE